MRKTLLLFVLVVCMLPLWSKPIDENTALKVAAQVLRPAERQTNADGTLQKSEEPLALKLVYKSSSKTSLHDRENADELLKVYKNNNKTADNWRENTNDEVVYFYVFVTEDNSSFVIVSADDRVLPVLGYSQENGFSTENMPDNLKWWLDEYAKQIAYAIENNLEPPQEIKQQWENYLNVDNDKK